jgi:AhpD family alkylhydroperoxidase
LRSELPARILTRMTTFKVHTTDCAPADSTDSLRALEKGLGFVPNLAATMAESPTLINGFVNLRQTLAGGELTGVEREIVALAVSLENDCDYGLARTQMLRAGGAWTTDLGSLAATHRMLGLAAPAMASARGRRPSWCW